MYVEMSGECREGRNEARNEVGEKEKLSCYDEYFALSLVSPSLSFLTCLLVFCFK